LLFFTWKNRTVLGARYFLLTLLLAEFWIAGQALEMAALDLATMFYPAEPSEPEGPTVAVMEKQMLLDYLAKYQYNKSEVAKAMAISRNTLYRHLHEHGLI